MPKLNQTEINDIVTRCENVRAFCNTVSNINCSSGCLLGAFCQVIMPHIKSNHPPDYWDVADIQNIIAVIDPSLK